MASCQGRLIPEFPVCGIQMELTSAKIRAPFFLCIEDKIYIVTKNYGLMHFRLARNKGATYVTLLWIASQKWIVADINEYHSLSLSSFSETKMRANVTHKHHPTLSGNEKRCLCIPKVRNKSSCACRIVSQMQKRLIMPPLIVRPHPREAKSWENVS